MVGYKSKKFLAESRDPTFHEKIDENLFYRMRHIKTFRDLTRNDKTIWMIRWVDGGNVQVYDKFSEKVLFDLGHDIHLAEYICALHNMSGKMIKEIETKYDRSF